MRLFSSSTFVHSSDPVVRGGCPISVVLRVLPSLMFLSLALAVPIGNAWAGKTDGAQAQDLPHLSSFEQAPALLDYSPKEVTLSPQPKDWRKLGPFAKLVFCLSLMGSPMSVGSTSTHEPAHDALQGTQLKDITLSFHPWDTLAQQCTHYQNPINLMIPSLQSDEIFEALHVTPPTPTSNTLELSLERQGIKLSPDQIQELHQLLPSISSIELFPGALGDNKHFRVMDKEGNSYFLKFFTINDAFLINPNLKPGQFFRGLYPLFETSASQVAHFLTNNLSPLGRTVGKTAILYPFIKIDKEKTEKFKQYYSPGPEDLFPDFNQSQKEQLFGHMVTSLLLDNTDTHLLQFAIDSQGNVIGFDHGTAFLHIAFGPQAADFEKLTFSAIERPLLFDTLLKHLKENSADLKKILQSKTVQDVLNRSEQFTSEELGRVFSPMIHHLHLSKKEISSTGSVEKSLYSRFHTIREKLATYFHLDGSDLYPSSAGMIRKSQQVNGIEFKPHVDAILAGESQFNQKVIGLIQGENLSELQRWLEKNPKVLKSVDHLGRNFLQLAIQFGTEEIALWALGHSHESEKIHLDLLQLSPLHYAVLRGFKKASHLLADQIDLDSSETRTIIELAIENRHDELLRSVISKIQKLKTPLSTHPQLSSMLTKVFEMDGFDSERVKLLKIYERTYSPEVVRLIGIQILAENLKNGEPLPHYAVRTFSQFSPEKFVALAKLLSPEELMVKDKLGRTALNIAIESRKSEFEMELISHLTADQIMEKDYWGNNLLHHYVDFSDLEAVKILVKRLSSSQVMTKNSRGETSLDLANSYKPMSEILNTKLGNSFPAEKVSENNSQAISLIAPKTTVVIGLALLTVLVRYCTQNPEKASKQLPNRVIEQGHSENNVSNGSHGNIKGLFQRLKTMCPSLAEDYSRMSQLQQPSAHPH